MRKSIVYLTLMFLAADIALVPFVGANPYGPIPVTEIPAPQNVKLVIVMTSPIENAVYTNGTLNVCFNVTLIDPISHRSSLFMSLYRGDWMNDTAWCPFLVKSNVWYSTDFLRFNFSIIDIPFGEHSLEITPTAEGNFIRDNTAYHFSLNKTISANFFMRSDPIIAFQTAQNTNSTNSTFPLNFTVDHSVQEITYRLDGKEPTPIDGNTTLTGLPNGQHNLTVSAIDEFDNAGNSNTLYFSVQASDFPAIPIVACITAFVVVFVVTGLVFYKRRKSKPA